MGKHAPCKATVREHMQLFLHKLSTSALLNIFSRVQSVMHGAPLSPTNPITTACNFLPTRHI